MHNKSALIEVGGLFLFFSKESLRGIMQQGSQLQAIYLWDPFNTIVEPHYLKLGDLKLPAALNSHQLHWDILFSVTCYQLSNPLETSYTIFHFLKSSRWQNSAVYISQKGKFLGVYNKTC